MRMKGRPGVFTHIICCILCLLLTVTTVAAGLLGALAVTCSAKQLHLNGMTSDEMLAAQMTAIDSKLTELAELYHFDKTPIAALVTEEDVRQLDADVVSWLTGLFSADPVLDAPSFNADAAYDLVLADEGFKEYCGSNAYAYARRVVKGVKNAVNQTVLPVRSQLITLALKYINGKVDITRVTALISWLPVICFGVMLVLSGLLLLLCGRLICKGRLYIGCGLGAGGLLTVFMLIGLLVLNLPGLFGSYSAMMSLELTSVFRWLLPGIAAYGVICLAIAALLIRSHQKKMVVIRDANTREVPA